MKAITHKKRVNQGWNNYPAEVNIMVDDKLHQLLSIIQENKSIDDSPQGDDCVYYKKLGVMSQDRGFGWVNLTTKEHGKGIGMFYGGIGQGQEYVDLTMINSEKEYRYEDLIKVS